jgi:hypothetical protein
VLLALLAVWVGLWHSRVAVFESANGYLASSLGYSTLQWALGVGIPVLVGTVLLAARTERPRVVPLAVGLLAGATVGLLDIAASSVALMVDEDVGYAAGPAWWSSLAAMIGLALCVVVLVRKGLAGAPRVRRDRPAAIGAVVVLAGLGGWIWCFLPDRGWSFVVYCQALLLAVACLTVALLGGSPPQRTAGLVAVTVAGAWVVGTQVAVLAGGGYWSTAGDAVGALLCAVVMVGGSYLSQLVPRRDVTAG